MALRDPPMTSVVWRARGNAEPTVPRRGTAGFGNGLTEDREVPPTDFVGRRNRETLRQVRRSHNVSEQDGQVFCGHRGPCTACTAHTVGAEGLGPQASARIS
jgi:hypothetical protein